MVVRDRDDFNQGLLQANNNYVERRNSISASCLSMPSGIHPGAILFVAEVYNRNIADSSGVQRLEAIEGTCRILSSVELHGGSFCHCRCPK
jgi:hypothetical protein